MTKHKPERKRKSLRTYLSFRCMQLAVMLDARWVAHASLALVRQRVEHELQRLTEQQDWDPDEDDDPSSEYITVTYH